MENSNKYKIRAAIFFFAFLLSAVYYSCHGQEEVQGSASIGLGFGTQILTEPGTDARSHIHSNLQVRKMFNSKFGVFGRGSLDAIQSVRGAHEDCEYKYIGRSLNLGVASNTGRILKFEEFAPNLTIVNTFGAGRTLFTENSGNLNDQGVWSLSIGTELLYRIGERTSISLSHTRLGFMGLDRTLDNANDITTSGMDTFLDQFSIGLVGHLFKGKKKDHLDWYIGEEQLITEPLYIPEDLYVSGDTSVTAHPIQTKTDSIQSEALLSLIDAVTDIMVPQETIYFRYDKFAIDQPARNAITKVANYLNANPDMKAVLTGWACISGKEEYNQALSENRAKSVFFTLINLGVRASQLSWVGKGIDSRFTNEINHDFPRRVDIDIVEK